MNSVKKLKTAQTNERVDSVVQEYMDTLLADLFPETSTELESTIEEATETEEKIEVEVKEEVQLAPPKAVKPEITVIQQDSEPLTSESLTSESLAPELSPTTVQEEVSSAPEQIITAPILDTPVREPEIQVEQIDTVSETQSVEEDQQVTEEVEVKPSVPLEKLFPDAPDWAQQSFDVLLFDVCGLKLAVPMDTLGRIIKCEKELNSLIGRPNWFMGAFTEAEESLYVVDTAKYIMPEKGFDLTRDGFDYLIQLQRSKWSLACQNVHTTVRLEPDQVKWRSQQGKRQWLAGTVIEHMCALVHVDTLVDILEAEAS